MESILMRITRARYVTICQQFLVTAVVVVVGLSAAGVMTLQIVAPEAPQASGMTPAVNVTEAYADTAPVTPKVREVKVSGIDPQAAREIPGVVTAPDKPARSARTAGKPATTPSTLVALSAPTPVHGYATVGVTWAPGANLADGQISVQVRTMKNGTWSGWSDVKYDAEEGPKDDGSEGRTVRPGTDPLVIGDVDQVQMKAETVNGKAPADLELAVIDPGTGKVTKQAAAIDTAKIPASDRTATSSAPIEQTAPATEPAQSTQTADNGDALALSAMALAPKPQIFSRAQWGANEALRDKSSLHYGTIKTGFIHHTVNANNYTPAQVPALLRGIYAYHTQTRGWSDIGYNFLVDRFGRIWEGRYGGVDRPVVGAHTLGYNEVSFAMSAIGNFDIAQPPPAVASAYASLFAWKLSMYNIRADATRLWVKNRYLHAINGHRDVGQTACPGRYLYAQIPSIRLAAQAIQNRAQTPVDPAAMPVLPAPAGLPAPTQAPAAAAAQPQIRMPARTSMLGTPWPDFAAMLPGGAVRLVSTEGILGFRPRVLSAGPWRYMNAMAAVGDVTGDGRGDVLGRTRPGGVTMVYPGDGAGHVRSTGIRPTKAFRGYDQIIGAGDFDKDGHNDVIARQKKTGWLMLFPGTGQGTFNTPVRLKKKWPFQLTVAAGRFDGDRRPDLIGMLPGGRLFLVPGLGKAHKLGAGVYIGGLGPNVTGLFSGGDLTGDRISDLVVRNNDGTSTIYAGTGHGRLGTAYRTYTDLGGLARATSGQMLGNVGPEVVGMDVAGRLAVVAGNGMRNLGAVTATNLTVPGATQVLNVGDWDHNGTADLITRESAGDQLVLRPGLGNGRFGRGQSLGTGWADVRQLAAVGDVTGDGLPDLLGRISMNKPWTIFPGAGTKGFGAPELAPSSLRMFNQIGDRPWPITGWVFGSADRSFVPLAGGTVPSALQTADGASTTAYDFYLGVGDVNGDGVTDLLAREKGTGMIWLLPGKASGGFAPRVWVASGFAGYQLLG
jgi:hypothetical protein